jgi:diguanylate cyclase (GGDEF)-like protein
MTLLVGFNFIPENNPLFIVSFYIIVILFPSAIGFLNYNQTKLLVKMREEVKRQRDLLDNISKIDGLTNIPNRRRFDEYMDLQWQNALRSGSPMSIIMLDIDHFKAYNDFYGHGSGDECLKKVAKRLSEIIKRPNDMIARYGGEEFVCLLPATDLEGAKNLADDMRKGIISLSIPHEKSKTAEYVTISLGVSSMTPTKESIPTELLKSADKALYEAKNSNRNCVKCKMP